MSIEGTREGRPQERVCCEEGCDRPAAQGDVRCELHVLRMGGVLHAKPGPKPLPVVNVPVLDAIAPMQAIALPQAPKKRAGPRLAGAAICQVLGLASVAALLETFRYLDFHAFDDLPNLALFEVPYSALLNVYVPVVGGVALLTTQLVFSWSGRKLARGRWGRRLGAALFAAGLVTALVAGAVVAGPLRELLTGKGGP
ncbi:MAG: hypothetical protein QM765_51070 [Myxococcales bacterium]